MGLQKKIFSAYKHRRCCWERIIRIRISWVLRVEERLLVCLTPQQQGSRRKDIMLTYHPDAFKRKVQETGKSTVGFNTDAFLNIQGESTTVSQVSTPTATSSAPPRMFSDRCVNVFFQEWAPLFPVLHKPSFLRLYEEYVANPEEMTDPHKLAQLNLVFGIAGISSNLPERQLIVACEQQWRSALETVLMDNTLVTLQCLVLALVYCILKADYTRLQHYKGIAVGLSHRLGLHQSQKRFSFGALTTETRKRVFWTLYTVDW